MFRLPLLVLVSLAIAFGAGTWSTRVALRATSGFGALRLGPWQAFPDLQSAAADPYAKAHRANDGRLLLGRAEGLVFTAATDSDGRELRGDCRYEISGTTPAARFWTLRITDADDRPLLARAGLPSSLDAWQAVRRDDGSFAVQVGARAKAGNWLAMHEPGPVRFVLTLIDTPTAGATGLSLTDMPAITLEGCADA
ncbi:DUF1214 domain-containing protein [Hoeflea marina]|uniref:DUF1214 domain-containing protein n=1 Tax=Hoeflea marina TaxID=274592 RepID=UPI000D71CD08|nr:DUF1214 domain-containing protein [Hoeflea marina]